jgi:hypothetical protein
VDISETPTYHTSTPLWSCRVARIWTRLGWQGMVELWSNSARCMRISGFLMKAYLAFEP